MYARAGFVGITRGTNRAHLCRAVLEGIAFQVQELVTAMEEASGKTISSLKVDGGASASRFLMQFEADLLGISVTRPDNIETTALGAAYMAAITCGIFTPETLFELPVSSTVFTPKEDRAKAEERMARWQKAVKAIRCY